MTPTAAPSPTERRPDEVRGMFDAVAPRYDLLNHVLSGGMDLLWRRWTVGWMGLAPGERVLDVCCGTGDLSLALARSGAKPVGCDFSPAMLALARPKLGGIPLVQGDALSLPFPNASFDASAVAFGFRNTADWARAARELARVVRPGGTVAVLDFGLPEGRLLAPLYGVYFRNVLPRLAGLLSRRGAYDYLQSSVAHFRAAADVEGLLRDAGCAEVRRAPFTFGTVVLWMGRKA